MQWSGKGLHWKARGNPGLGLRVSELRSRLGFRCPIWPAGFFWKLARWSPFSERMSRQSHCREDGKI